jgi:hypothetical protein
MNLATTPKFVTVFKMPNHAMRPAVRGGLLNHRDCV